MSWSITPEVTLSSSRWECSCAEQNAIFTSFLPGVMLLFMQLESHLVFFFGSCCWLVVDFLMTKTSHSFSYMLLQRPILIVLLEDNWLFGPGYRMCWYLSFFQCLCLQFVYRWDLAIFPLGKRYRITVLPVFPLILFLWPWWWCCVQGLAQRP